MPYKKIPNTDVAYALIAFDNEGRERTDDPDGLGGLMSRRIQQDAAANPPTHVFLFSVAGVAWHGRKG